MNEQKIHKPVKTINIMRQLKMKFPTLLVLAILFCNNVSAQVNLKTRVLILTDIEADPDDTQSLIRFLLYSNQWDVEGLVATTSIHQKTMGGTRKYC